MSHEERKGLIVPHHPHLSISRQAALLDISRSSIYYAPTQNPKDKEIMDLIDVIYTDYPFYGSRRIKNELCDRNQLCICREHVQRLMRLMGIQAIYPKKHTSIPAPGHTIYPYLLRNLAIIRPNQVWSTDITYVRLAHEFCYLTVILDWYSRYVISWELACTMETDFCMRALQSALRTATPEIHNSDQGSQYTSFEYTDMLKAHHIQISMDGRGRCLDNIFTERLWRSVKYEDVYLKHYRTLTEAYTGLGDYFSFYNHKRRHQALDYQTPEHVYRG